LAYPPAARYPPIRTVIAVETYIFVSTDGFSFSGSSKNSWNINLPSLVAVSKLVKANADTAKATKDLPISKGIPNLDMKVPTPDENTLTGPPFNNSVNSVFDT
jgi:hypothetical protein